MQRNPEPPIELGQAQRTVRRRRDLNSRSDTRPIGTATAERLSRSKPRLLWLGDSPTCPTGYGRVTHELLYRLQRLGYEVACLGRGYDGWPYDSGRYTYPILPTGADLYGSDAVGKALAVFQPQIFVALGDLWMFPWIRKARQKDGPLLVGYIPIDGGPLPYSSRNDYRQFDKLVTASQFGQRQLNDILPDLNIDVVYHGVDPEVFRPLDNRASIKEQYGLPGKFVIGCVAANHLRKQLPTLFKAFARFHSRHPDSVLYLHTSNDGGGWALDDFVTWLGLSGAVVYPKDTASQKDLSDEKLNKLYNLFDVMVLPTAGEGFGLPILEAMSAGVPVVATDYSACPELLMDRGFLIKVKDYIYLGGQIVQNVLPDVDDLHAKLCEIYDNPKTRVSIGPRARAFACSCGWDSAVKQWDRILCDLAALGRCSMPTMAM